MFYYLRKKRLSSGETQYYLYKIIYLGNGRKKWIPIAPCEEIEKIVNLYKQQIGQFSMRFLLSIAVWTAGMLLTPN